MTSLFLVLLVIESTDVVFAIDSVPAIFGITNDTFIVFTSNVFAIMGLRALYFLLAGVMGMFRYLHYGLSAILVFIGMKMLLHDVVHINPVLSLVIILSLLAMSVVASLDRGPAGSGRGDRACRRADARAGDSGGFTRRRHGRRINVAARGDAPWPPVPRGKRRKTRRFS